MSFKERIGRLQVWGIVIVLLGILLAACAPASQPPSEPVKLRMAVLPILDTLPMYVAAEQGYFAENGIEVEFIPVASAPERDSLIQAGQADGMINEIISALFYNQEEVQIQVVRYARTASAQDPLFRILVAKDSGITNLDELKDAEIAISEGTIIAYLTDRLLQAEGFSDEDIKTIPVPAIPERMALLGAGELKAAMLPDPLSSLAIQGGASVILDDTRHPEFGFSVISFTMETINEHPEAIRGFLSALEKAVVDINSNPEQWDSLLSDKNLVPEPVRGTYTIPTFPEKGIPTENQFNDAVNWAVEKGLVSGEFEYGDTITGVYLP